MIFGKVRQVVCLISTHGYYSCRTEASELDTSVCLPQRSGQEAYRVSGNAKHGMEPFGPVEARRPRYFGPTYVRCGH